MEEQVNWNMEAETFSGTNVAKKKKKNGYFNLKEKNKSEHLSNLHLSAGMLQRLRTITKLRLFLLSNGCFYFAGILSASHIQGW